jgi:predicted tellurium resistance membrane protein TerC
MATPLFLCLICIELSDIVFAFDSVPAIFGVTSDPFIVYSSNLFAICSLRSLFGVLSAAIEQLKYLEKAVGIILAVIATKLTASTFDIEILDPLQSLLVVVSLLGAGIGLSVIDNDRNVLETKEKVD